MAVFDGFDDIVVTASAARAGDGEGRGTAAYDKALVACEYRDSHGNRVGDSWARSLLVECCRQ